MENRIRRAAIKFYRSLNGNLTNLAVISTLKKDGYEVIFYNTPEGDAALEIYGLYDYSRTVRAFTLRNEMKIVFVDDALSATDKLKALLHEAGHIRLGHIGTGNMHLCDSADMEGEATAFVYEVMSPTLFVPRSLVAVSLLLIVLSFICGYNFTNENNEVPIAPALSQIQQAVQPTSESAPKPYQVTTPVYITRTGSKYHKEECTYTKDKDCAEIDRTQAEILFSPCSACNP